MNYRSFADLEQCIRNNLYKIPRDTDIVLTCINQRYYFYLYFLLFQHDIITN